MLVAAVDMVSTNSLEVRAAVVVVAGVPSVVDVVVWGLRVVVGGVLASVAVVVIIEVVVDLVVVIGVVTGSASALLLFGKDSSLLVFRC